MKKKQKQKQAHTRRKCFTFGSKDCFKEEYTMKSYKMAFLFQTN